MTDAADPSVEIVSHLPALRAFAMTLTRDPVRADDLVQDTLVKAWAGLEGFEAGTNLRAWLFTILRNTYYSERRRAWREVEDPQSDFAAHLSEKPAHDGRLMLRDFARVFSQLPEEQREALMLVGAMGFSYEDAAHTCDVATGTIKSRVNRARARLAIDLEVGPLTGFELTDAATQVVVNQGFGQRRAR